MKLWKIFVWGEEKGPSTCKKYREEFQEAERNDDAFKCKQCDKHPDWHERLPAPPPVQLGNYPIIPILWISLRYFHRIFFSISSTTIFAVSILLRRLSFLRNYYISSSLLFLVEIGGRSSPSILPNSQSSSAGKSVSFTSIFSLPIYHWDRCVERTILIDDTI